MIPLAMHPLRALALTVIVAGLAAGCSKDSSPTKPPPPAPVTARYSWIGQFDDGSQRGDVIVDVNQNGSSLAGEVSVGNLGLDHSYVLGTLVADSVYLHMDPAHGPNATDLVLAGRIQPSGDLVGRLVFVPNSLDATLDLRELPRKSLVADVPYPSTLGVIGIAYDGTQMWLSTSSDDYILMDLDGTLTDTVVVIHSPNAHWMSSVLGYDGTRMWGVYPISIIGPNGREDTSDLLGFDATGRTPDSVHVGHRPAGLAFVGPYSWSLRTDPSALVRFDETGIVTDSVHVEVPDPYGLAFDGLHFWTIGWFLRRLYEIDATGHVRSMCDLPRDLPVPFALGVVIEGNYIWYGEGNVGQTVLHRMTIE